jgi:hypothetical protein
MRSSFGLTLIGELFADIWSILKEFYSTNYGFWIIQILLIAWTCYLLFKTFSHLNKSRTIGNIATSKIRSAAIGYTELKGRVRAFKNHLFQVPYASQPCVWYRIVTEVSDNQLTWYKTNTHQTDHLFVIEDETGKCYVLPNNADFTVAHKSTWYNGNSRFTVEFIMEGELAYVLGDLHAIPHAEPANFRQEVRKLITKWHLKPEKSLSIYDENNNGKLESSELRVMHEDAKTAVRMALKDVLIQDDISMIKNPSNFTKPFLIATYPEESLINEHRKKAFQYLSAFFIFGSIILWQINLRFS